MLTNKEFVKAKVYVICGKSIPNKATPEQRAKLERYEQYVKSLDRHDRNEEFSRILPISHGDENYLTQEYKRDIPPPQVQIIEPTDEPVIRFYVGETTAIIEQGAKLELEDTPYYNYKHWYKFKGYDGLFETKFFVEEEDIGLYIPNKYGFSMGAVTPVYKQEVKQPIQEKPVSVPVTEEPKPKISKPTTEPIIEPVREHKVKPPEPPKPASVPIVEEPPKKVEDKKLKTIAEFAREQGVTVQTIYRRLDRSVKRGEEGLTEKVKSITYLTARGEEVLKGV
jgi:hypothetical protein